MIVRHIPKVLTEEHNKNLNNLVSMEEVTLAVNEMDNGKDPRPDGFTIDFFKACWEIVKYDIYEVVEDSQESITILKALNSTFIALIPKEELASTPEKFRR